MGLTDTEKANIIEYLRRGYPKGKTLRLLKIDTNRYIEEYKTNAEFKDSVDEIYKAVHSNITENVKIQIIENLRQGMSFSHAATAAGLHPGALAQYCAYDPSFFTIIRGYLRAIPKAEQHSGISTDQKMVIIDLLKKGVSRTEACRKAGVNVTTFNRYMAIDPDLREIVTEIELQTCEKVEEALYQAALNGNFQAQKFWLCNRFPERWKDISSRQEKSTKSIEVNVHNIIDDIDRLALEYEEKFKRSPGLAASDRCLKPGGDRPDRVQGNGNPPEDRVGKPVYTARPVSPAKNVSGV